MVMLFFFLVTKLFDLNDIHKKDFIVIGFVFVNSSLYTMGFAYITNNMQKEKMNEEKKMGEFK